MIRRGLALFLLAAVVSAGCGDDPQSEATMPAEGATTVATGPPSGSSFRTEPSAVLFTRSDVEVGWSEATGRALVAKELAVEPDVSPNQLPGLLITPLRRRADQFDLPLPFEVTQAKGGKLRQWEDFGGVASRMTRVLESAAPRTVRS